MKKCLSILFLIITVTSIKAQEKVLTLPGKGNLRYIPSFATKDVKPILYFYNDNGITVYDDNLNVIKSYEFPPRYITCPYRTVYYTRLVDPDTKEFLSEWTQSSESTGDGQFDVLFLGIDIHSELSAGISEHAFLSQTLFDEDEDFELVRLKYEIVPITTNKNDYASAQVAEDSNVEPQYGPDEWWREYGAYSCRLQYNAEKQKDVYVLKKKEEYGGCYIAGIEIVNLDGVVEKTINGLQTNSLSAYYLDGNLYVMDVGGDSLYRLNSHKLPALLDYVSCDLNLDGKVNVADHVKLSSVIMDKKLK